MNCIFLTFILQYDETKRVVADELNNNLTYGSVKLDGWISNATESFLGITCHYIDSDFY